VDDLLRRLDYVEARGQALVATRAREILEGWKRGTVALPLSSIVCTAVLGSPMSPAEVKATWGNDSDRVEHFSWAWPLHDVRPEHPIVPARGAQGFWRWTPPDA
jgi:hypothetical protein